MEQKTDSLITISQAARIKKVTRQAIYLAIRLNRLRAYKHGTRWKMFLSDLHDYDRKRFTEHHFFHNGERIFDEQKGSYSITKASELIQVPKQKLYHAIRYGMLKAERIRASYVIQAEDLFNYKVNYLKNEVTKNKGVA